VKTGIITTDTYSNHNTGLGHPENADRVSVVIENLKIIKNKKLPLEERFAAQLKLAKIPRNSSKVRIRNRCEITGRPHGVYRKLKISRIALRDLASKGKIPGMTKSSW